MCTVICAACSFQTFRITTLQKEKHAIPSDGEDKVLQTGKRVRLGEFNLQQNSIILNVRLYGIRLVRVRGFWYIQTDLCSVRTQPAITDCTQIADHIPTHVAEVC